MRLMIIRSGIRQYIYYMQQYPLDQAEIMLDDCNN